MPSIPINSSAASIPVASAPSSRAMLLRVRSLNLTASGATILALVDTTGKTIWSTQAANVTTPAGIVLPPEQVLDGTPGAGLNLTNASGVTVQGSVEVVSYGSPLVGDNLLPGFGG